MASGGRNVADSVPTSMSNDDAKITGPNSSRPLNKKAFGGTQSTSTYKHHECNHGSKVEAAPIPSSDRTPPTRAAPAQPKPRRVGARLEDVFQDEIVIRFPKMTEFKKFARSSSGLGLADYDVENIIEDYRQSEEQKLQMLYLWKQKKGKAATTELIRRLVDEYFNRATYFDQD